MRIDGRELSVVELAVAVVLLIAPFFVEFVLVAMVHSRSNWFKPRFYVPINFERVEPRDYESEPWTREAVLAQPRPTQEEIGEMLVGWGNFYGVNPSLMRTIAFCESGFNPGALSSNGLYAGMFQFEARTWVGVRKRMGLDPNPNLRYDAQESIKTAAQKLSEGGHIAWPVCSRKYYVRS